MPKIKHIAISTQDVDKTARFYVDVFGLQEIARIDSPGARGYYLSDGDLSIALLNCSLKAGPCLGRAPDPLWGPGARKNVRFEYRGVRHKLLDAGAACSPPYERAISESADMR